MGKWRETSSATTEPCSRVGVSEEKGEQRAAKAGRGLCAGIQQCWLCHAAVVRDLAENPRKWTLGTQPVPGCSELGHSHLQRPARRLRGAAAAALCFGCSRSPWALQRSCSL